MALTKILIVDDNKKNAELLEAYLIPLEADVTIAPDGIEALKMIEQDKPDLILLDIMMPRMSGFEVCRRIKGSESYRDIVVVLVTALTDAGDIERGVDCGADEFLSKPIQKNELISRVRTLLRIKRTHCGNELEKNADLYGRNGKRFPVTTNLACDFRRQPCISHASRLA